MKLTVPLDKKELGISVNRTRYIRTIRVDNAFLCNGKLIGIGEVVTPGLLHYGISSQKLRELRRSIDHNTRGEITTYDKLIHIAKTQENVKFIIILVSGPWKIFSGRKSSWARN